MPYNNLPFRFIQYVWAVAKHFYLLGVAILFTFLPWFESFMNHDQQQRFDAIVKPLTWNRWTALLLGFLATFFTWKEERDLREKAELRMPEEHEQRLNEHERTITSILENVAVLQNQIDTFEKESPSRTMEIRQTSDAIRTGVQSLGFPAVGNLE